MKTDNYTNLLIEWFKGGEEPPESPLLKAFQKLQLGAPDKFIQQAQGFMEFKEAKLMRSNMITINEEIENIIVEYIGFKNKSNGSSLPSTEESKKD